MLVKLSGALYMLKPQHPAMQGHDRDEICLYGQTWEVPGSRPQSLKGSLLGGPK